MHNMSCRKLSLGQSLKWQSLSLDYLMGMHILLNQFIMWYVHVIRFLGSQ